MRGRWLPLLVLMVSGCGGPSAEPPAETPGGGPGPSAASAPSSSGRRIAFVGFDASEPLVNALRAGKLQGLVLQDPYAMGEIGVRTLVDLLEKRPVKPRVGTGETLATPENMTEPGVARLLNPPKEESSADANLSGARTKKWRVMVIPKGTTHEFWKSIHAGARKAAEAIGSVELIWQGTQKEDDRLQQIQLVQSAVAAQVDGIVLAPLDSRALAKPVEEAVARNVPVVVIDSGLESQAQASFVATDNEHGGAIAAQRLGELLHGEGRVVLLRYAVGSASTEQREKGFTDALARDFPKITLLSDSEYAGATPESAQQKAQNLLTRYRGQIDGIFCPNESSTVGMLRALEGAGMVGK